MRHLITPVLCAILLSSGHAHARRTDLLCEKNQRISVGGNVHSDSVIELTWRGKPYRMKRVGTSTGAHRFEDPISGLIWISIPAKAMLLDSRLGAPVVNECKAALVERHLR